MNYAMRVYFHTNFPPSVAYRITNVSREEANFIVVGIIHGHAHRIAWARNQIDGYRIKKVSIDHGSEYEQIIVIKIHRLESQSEIQKAR